VKPYPFRGAVESARPIVERCGEADLDSIMRIEQASFPDPYTRRLFSQFLRWEPDGFLVVKERGETIGYAMASSKDGYGMILSIAVSPGHRRKGIGALLMHAALEHLTGKVERVQLQVNATNEKAIGFYRRFGFRETGRLENYYQNGDDAVEMTLVLKGSE
jgi:ribosomal-protein-alanine N-acetyltransferase